MYFTVMEILEHGKNIGSGLSHKLKELRHNLRFETIDVAKCKTLISTLMDEFEVVILAQLEEKTMMDRLFGKFTELCNVFVTKKTAGAGVFMWVSGNMQNVNS